MNLRDMSGFLFVNDRKTTPEQPGYTGKAMVDGQFYYLSAWVKEGKKGKFMSLAFKEPNENRVPEADVETEAHPVQDEDIPF